MEIIQTIWTALTTENEILANLVTSPLIFLEATAMMLLFTTLLNMTSTSKQKIIYIFFISVTSLISRYLISDPYGTIINLIINFLLISFIFKPGIIKSIIAQIIPLIIMVLIEYIISNVYSILFQKAFESLLYIPIYRFIATSIIYLVMLLLYYIFKKFSLKFYILENMTLKNKFLLGINLIIFVASLIAQVILTTFYSNTLPFIITFLSILNLISYTFLAVIILRKTTKLQLTEIDLEETKMYNKTLSILHDNIRGFKHDFNNILQAIGGYVDTNDMVGLKKYYSQLELDCQRANNLSALNPDTINNPAIYSILASKYHRADELGIKVNLEIFLDLNKLNMKIYEFTRILGILLDNAIEATYECTEKVINVIIRKDFNLNRQLLIIENTYNNKNVDIEKIFEKGYSSKENNTGLGLWEVRQILHKNNNLNLFTSKDDILFKQQLEIY